MEWIERVEWHEGQLMPIFVNKSGQHRPGALADSKAFLGGRRKQEHNRFSFSTSLLKLCSAKPYLSAMGFDLAVDEGHEVFSLQLDSITYVIPAYVFIMAIGAMWRVLAPEFLKPMNTSHRFLADFSTDPPSVIHKFGRPSTPDLRPLNSFGLSEKLMWLSSYPSAQRMWASVFLKGCSGVLGCDVAEATMSVRLSAKSIGKTRFVYFMHICGLTPQEDPFPFAAQLGRRDFVFKDMSGAMARIDNLCASRDAAHKSKTFVGDHTLLCANGGSAQTDQEWGLVQEVLFIRQRRVKDARHNIDVILEKLSSGRPWQRFGITSKYKEYYWRCLESGSWPRIYELLQASRASVRHDSGS